jgi:hypothetical protein
MAATAHFSPATLARAAAGHRLPSLEVVVAYATACGADREEWEQLWRACAEEAARARAESRAVSAPPDHDAGSSQLPQPGQLASPDRVPTWRRRRTRLSAAALAAVAIAAAGVVLGVRATSGAPSQPGPASVAASGSTSDPQAPDTQPLGRACNEEGIIADISGAPPSSPGRGRVRMSFEAGFKVGTLWSSWWRPGWVTEDVTTSQAYDGKQSLRVRVTGPLTAIGTNHIAGLMPGGRVTVHIWYGGQGAGYICPFAEDKASTDDWIPQTPLQLNPSDHRGWYTYSWPMATNFLPLGTGFQLNKTSRSDFVILLDAVTW